MKSLEQKQAIQKPDSAGVGINSGINAGATSQYALVKGEDYYLEGDAIVFTAHYHLRRGYCCESGCRHCPYPAVDG